MALAEEFADAVLRGVRLVAEIHSQLLLLTVQTLVAEGKLSPEAVKLHWFERDGRGETAVHSTDIDKAGPYGDGLENLVTVYLQAEGRHLDAHEARRSRRWRDAHGSDSSGSS